MFAKFIKFITKKYVIVSAVAFLAFGGLIYRSVSAGKPALDTVTVARGDITQEVTATGSIEPISSLDLAFEKGGRVIGVNADVGNKVYAGETLVSLDSSELKAQLAQAKANVQAAQATLDSLQVSAAEQTLVNDYNGVPTALNDAYSKADDAVRNQVDQFLTNPYIASSMVTVTDLQASRVTMGVELASWRAALDGLSVSSPTDTLDKAIIDAQTHLQSVAGFLDKAMNAIINSSIPYTSYKTAISTGRTEISTALTNVNTLANTISSQKILAGQSPDNVRAQAAGLAEAQASVELIQAQLRKTNLISPISGTVTVQNAKLGEVATAGATLVSVISDDRLQIESDIPEADIAKIVIGDKTTFTLDALGSDVIFNASVISVNPAETIIEGVATYRTKFKLLEDDARIKPGMTANLTVVTGERKNVLVVPQRSIYSNADGMFAQTVDTKNNSVEKKIETVLMGTLKSQAA
jgi:HlyD family secretion protein